MAIPRDPLYARQWHFGLIGDIQTIWNEFTGAGVTVAVLDEGTQYTHPDLAANYDATQHFFHNGMIYDGVQVNGSKPHGTAVAGLIGAVEGNGIGGVGVAWDVTITAQNWLNVTQHLGSGGKFAALSWAANFDIMNNSWGAKEMGFEAFQNLSNRNSDRGRIDAVYAEISASGRGGLGTVIVQAAGNDTSNANGDGLHASRFTITVAATQANGATADYSNYGVSLLVAAPAAAVTTDLLGNAGYNTATDADPLDRNYTGSFNGTSAAAPVVSGVVALMLQANPGLGWRDVQNILAMSAALTGQKLGEYDRADGERTDYLWETNTGNQWNGGGNGYHLDYGYGMVDAFAATRMAEAWLTLQGGARTSANEIRVSANSARIDRPLADAMLVGNNPTPTPGVTTLARKVSQAVEIETIYVTIEIKHSLASQLEISLETPFGEKIELFQEDLFDVMTNGLRWTFAVEAFRGYSSLGTWRLSVVDNGLYVFGNLDQRATGVLRDFDLDFFGAPVSANDVYHFTDDYLEYRGFEAARATVDDANGGTDWLNFSAVAGDIQASLVAGSVVRVDGVNWVALSSRSNAFERFYSGDGDDTVTGNNGHNAIYGARGNDLLSGGNGNDMLDGGQGDDRLLGGSENDVLRGGDGRDTLAGQTGDDELIGGAGNDSLQGNDGTDTLEGGEGNDTLEGGTGNDRLVGAAGLDVFVFGDNFGLDTLTDFADNVDTLRFDNALWTGVLSVQQVITTFATNLVGGGVRFDFGVEEVTLSGLADRQVLIDDLVIY